MIQGYATEAKRASSIKTQPLQIAVSKAAEAEGKQIAAYRCPAAPLTVADTELTI